MDPWRIIGWILLPGIALIAGAVALWFLGANVVAPAYWHWLHVGTRNTPPATGQVWMQRSVTGPGFDRIEITAMLPTGNVVVRSGNRASWTSWTDTPEGWRRRVLNRKLFLVAETGVRAESKKEL